MTIHVHPTADLAPRALLPGDPGRALAMAQTLLDEPRMFNHNRGLWGYTGPAKADGAPLTIQSTGMGGPSAAIVVHELIELGAGERANADPQLVTALAAAAGAAPVTIVTTDLFYDPKDHHADWLAAGAVAVEMEAATLFAVCAAQGVRAGCLLAVTDLLTAGRERIDHEGLVAAGERLGQVAVDALAL